MTLQEIMQQLEQWGSEQTKKTLMRHGAREPFFGVKVEDLKKIQKKVKSDYELSKQLYDTGNSDAMYLAGLIAAPEKMTKSDLQHWVEGAYWSMISEYTVPWVASESSFGFELALEWIQSPKENIVAAGWATLASIIAIKEDNDIDIEKFRHLIQKASADIHRAQNRVRYAMNNFIIAAGGYSPLLNHAAVDAASKIGVVTVDMGGTACKVPSAVDYIEKMKARGTLGKRRKSARC
jgi:3-methyladenine DNA glycosylase AlkD